MPLLLLFAVFVVVPIAELYVIIKVGEAIGVLPTIALLIADSLIGSALLRSQGRAVWRRFREATRQGRVPAREVLDGALVIFGGAFLITPGFLSDILGVLLLLPPTRAVIRRLLLGRFSKRLIVGMGGPAAGAAYTASRMRGRRGAPPGTPPPGPADPLGADYDVEGTAVEVDPPHLRQ